MKSRVLVVSSNYGDTIPNYFIASGFRLFCSFHSFFFSRVLWGRSCEAAKPVPMLLQDRQEKPRRQAATPKMRGC